MSQKKTICLNMIVKDESHIIKEGLESVYKFVDSYLIVDTGSSDNTIEIIETFFKEKNIPGKILSHNFMTCDCHSNEYKKYNRFHFGWNRTYALEKCLGKSDYILIMDADDLIVGDLPIKNLTKDCYRLKLGMGSGLIFYRPQLIKNEAKLKWKYVGGIHEYLDQSCVKTSETLEGDYYVLARTMGNRSQDKNKYLKDAQFLEQLLKDEPLNDRYTFYCAQSYYDHGDYSNAIKYYKKRIKMGGYFIGEIYYSMYRIGLSKINMNCSEHEVRDAFLKCVKFHSKRVEPLYELIKYYRIRDKFQEGYDLGHLALKIKYPGDSELFISKDVYDYKVIDEFALCAYYVNKFKESYDLWKRILDEKKYPDSEKKRLEANLKFALMNIQNKKQIICFFAGYTPNYNETSDNVYGSELALKSISELLTQKYDVYIFGKYFKNDIVNNVNFKNSSELDKFSQDNEIDIMIISRYIYYFIEHKICAKKTYIWLHDVLFQPYWNGTELLNNGKYLFENIMDKITGIITLCDWHKNYFLNNVKVDPNKVFILGNGINTANFITQKKIKNRFVYMSNPNRGLNILVKHFHIIHHKIPDAELYIYRGVEEFNDLDLLNEINKYSYIKFGGKLTNDKLINELEKAEYWYYPTEHYETYCISALEALMAGVICITSKRGALIDVVGNRGILIDKSVNSDDYINEAINYIIKFNNDEQLKENYINKAKKWATKQTWKNRYNEWLLLFKYD